MAHIDVYRYRSRSRSTYLYLQMCMYVCMYVCMGSPTPMEITVQLLARLQALDVVELLTARVADLHEPAPAAPKPSVPE